MLKWILRCLDFKKTVFSVATIVLIICSFGLKHLLFDFKLDVMKECRFTQQVAFITVYDKHILDSEHLDKLAKMQQELSQIQYVQKITGLYTVPNLRRYLDEGQWYNVLENQHYDPQSLDIVKSDILDNELYTGKFISKKADTMLFYLYLPRDKYGDIDLKSRKAIQHVLDNYQTSFTTLFQSGVQEISYALANKSASDLMFCIPALFLLMGIIFGCLFRNIFLAILPLGISAYGTLCGLGMMGWAGIPVSALFIVAMVLTLAITVASSAHMIYAYQESKEAFPEALLQQHFARMFQKILLPLILAATSALIGFLMDILSFIRVIQDLSYAFSLCIIFNTLATIFISPLLLSMISTTKKSDHKIFNYISSGFLWANQYLTTHYRKVAAILCVLGIAGIFCASEMKIESLPYAMFKKNDIFMKQILFSGDKISGQNVLQVDVYSNEKNIFLNSKCLQNILNMEKAIMQVPNTSYTYSASDVIATLNQLFLFNTKKFFKIPENSAMLKIYFKELSEQGFMSSLMNNDFNKLSIFVSYNIYTSNELENYKQKIDQIVSTTLKETPLKFKIIDFWQEYASIVDNLIWLQILSIASIYLICCIIVGVLFRSVKAGIISVIPNIIPLCVIAIVQYSLKIPVTFISVLLYSIIVGLSIDETVHMFYTFKQNFLTLKNREQAVIAAIKSQSTPVAIASLAIMIAGLALLASQFLPVVQLGFLMGVGILSTWLADLVITPFLLRKANITKRLKALYNYQGQ